MAAMVRMVHSSESERHTMVQVLAVDWSNYNDCVIATGSVDKSIKVWDVRMPQREMAVLQGHTYAVRR